MHSDPIAPVLITLVALLFAAKLGGEIFERLNQPSVLGELIAGVILGNLILINPDWTFLEPLKAEHFHDNWAIIIDSFARLGVILLLFEVGLESTVADMAKVGKSSLLVAVAGVIAPFALGFGISWIFIKELPADLMSKLPEGFGVHNIHIFIGATLCATSVGITARVFKDLGKLNIKEAKIILGAAVIDDVLGLIVLAVVAGIVSAAISGTTLDAIAIVRITAFSFGFLIAAIVLGVLFIPRILKLLAKLRTQGIMVISSLIFCFFLSWAADEVGLAAIVGAFAAGLILEEVHFKEFRKDVTLHQLVQPISAVFVPIFFVLMGIRVSLKAFANLDIIWLALGVTAAAIIGKQVCGLFVVEKGLDRLSVGLGMIPRGEVGLIFAGIGKSLGILDDALFSAIIIMVIITTFVTPPLLKVSLSRKKGEVTL